MIFLKITKTHEETSPNKQKAPEKKCKKLKYQTPKIDIRIIRLQSKNIYLLKFKLLEWKGDS